MTTLIEADYGHYQQQILHVREQVFIVEQKVPPELEVDELDPLSRHVLLFSETIPVATGRLTPDGHIGRIAVLKNHRHQGYGTQIIFKLEQIAITAGLKQVVLAAQLQALSFYERLGYQAMGGVFLDAGIEHRQMQKLLGCSY